MEEKHKVHAYNMMVVMVGPWAYGLLLDRFFLSTILNLLALHCTSCRDHRH